MLPMRPYAIEGYCKVCSGDVYEDIDSQQINLDGTHSKILKKIRNPEDHPCLITKNNGKFFKRVTPADLARYQRACEIWQKEKGNLPYPKQKIPWGEKTKSGLIAHHYLYWHQMFNPRQLLCLSTLLKAIDEEPDQILKEMLLSAFQNMLDCYCLFAYYPRGRQSLARLFTIHAFQPKIQPLENCIWGLERTGYTYPTFFSSVLKGKEFNKNPFDLRAKDGFTIKLPSKENIVDDNENTSLNASSSKSISISTRNVDLIITDPPYAGNVNYGELSDFSYVWLHQILRKTYKEFAPELTSKTDEIVENPTRGKSAEDFEIGLREVFSECKRLLKHGGLLSFTFHHAESKTWESLLSAICHAGFEIDSVYPIHSEAENSPHLAAQSSIAYDLIHICRRKLEGQKTQNRSWAGVRQEIRRKAREEIKAIEAGRYGNEPLSPADVNIILIGKCLELYSRHYGAVVDHEGNEVKLKDALEEIRMMVDQLVTTEEPLPSELADIDPESYVYLTCLCDRKEVKSDDVHKATRGILEPDSLIKAGIMIKGRAGRGRSYEVKQPSERFHALLEKFNPPKQEQQTLFGELNLPKTKNKVYFIDYVHLLMALAEGGENIVPWLERFRGETPRLRAACEYLMFRKKGFTSSLKKILGLIDIGSLFITR
ncbi:MAG: hypothetical protein JRI26_04015 [Deltaproteobacteria bacterium]|nr:hypothetical protein [Deltaproteobacteria bacterium]